MLSIEEYISLRKKEDRLDEYDLKVKEQNLKICVNYVFEYFNNYMNITEAEEKTVLKEEKVDKYRQQLRDYSPEIQDWLVTVYNDCGKHANRIMGNMLKDYEFFYLYDTDAEFRELSYELYAKLIKRINSLKGQSEMIFKFIKDYHRMKSIPYDFENFSFSEQIYEWLSETNKKHNVDLTMFAYSWVDSFWHNEDSWPASYRKKSSCTFRKYDYDHKQKSNLFSLDSLYRRIPKKSFIKGKKQELEILMMYYWLHDLEGDDEGYWQEYLEKVLPSL